MPGLGCPRCARSRVSAKHRGGTGSTYSKVFPSTPYIKNLETVAVFKLNLIYFLDGSRSGANFGGEHSARDRKYYSQTVDKQSVLQFKAGFM